MKIYLASAYGNWAKIRAWAVALRARGFDVVSTWHDLPQASADPPRVFPAFPLLEQARNPPPNTRRDCAMQCLHEARRADTLVFFDSELRSRGGLVELGCVLGDETKRVIWAELWGAGASANVFDSAYGVLFAGDDFELLRRLGIVQL